MLPPPTHRSGCWETTAKSRSGEIYIPISLKNFLINCCELADPIRPDQTIVSVISQELETPANSSPVFAPYIKIDYAKRPWFPAIVYRETSLNTFRAKMKSPKSIQPLSIHRYVLYRLRFVMAAWICSAFDGFGGAIDQISNLSIALRIAIIENRNIDILYDEERRNRLSKYERERTPPADYYCLISTLQVDSAENILIYLSI